MLEYKREKSTLETRLDEYARRATDHDDHLRVVDNWWLQVSYSFQRVKQERSNP